MKKKATAKQIIAIIGIVILAGMYISTLVFAIIGSAFAMNMLKASLLCTFVIPIVIYLIMMFYKLSHKDNTPEE